MADEIPDYRRLGGILASERITIKRYALECDLSYSLVSRILCGHEPGELARIKLARGLQRLGLETEVSSAG